MVDGFDTLEELNRLIKLNYMDRQKIINKANYLGVDVSRVIEHIKYWITEGKSFDSALDNLTIANLDAPKPKKDIKPIINKLINTIRENREEMYLHEW